MSHLKEESAQHGNAERPKLSTCGITEDALILSQIGLFTSTKYLAALFISAEPNPIEGSASWMS